jgi:hypothetical protein
MTLAPVSVITDVVAQAFSRTVTIAFAMICFAGFVFIVIKRKMREIDKAIFLTGVVYLGIGVVLLPFTLGSRALPIVFIPISLGILYLYQSKVRPYLKCAILILLVLVVFIPIHSSFGNLILTFQTKEAQTTANFMIEKYNWNLYSIVISDVGAKWYISPQIQGYAEIDTVSSSGSTTLNLTTYDCIVYSVGLAISLKMNNVSIEETSQQILDGFNVIYNSGFSYTAEKSG